MTTIAPDFSKWDQTIAGLTGIYEHRKAHPRSQTELLWYEYYIKYMQRVRDAWEKGDFIVSYFDAGPAEIIYAMDLVSCAQVVYGPGAASIMGNLEQATLESARQVGLTLETCSGWRMGLGMLMRGWYPAPGAIISGNATCDTCAKCYQLWADIADAPAFFIDTPFPAANERNVKFIAGELGRMIEFLEKHSGKKMDWDKLSESVILGRKMIELNLEIQEFLKVKPSPIIPRMTSQSYWFNWIYSGRPEGVHFLTALRDELKEKSGKGESGLPAVTKDGRHIKERFRLITIPPTPQIRGKTLEWLWREYGVSMAASTFMVWLDTEMDPSKPLESIARKFLYNPLIRQYWNPCESEYGTVTATVKLAQEVDANGVVIWGNPSCDATSGFIKIMRDRLLEVGIPSVVFDHDPADQTYTSEDALKEKMEEFMDVLESRE